jgi:hypothetical protein
MHDRDHIASDYRHARMPADWSEAFAALPATNPPDCWPQVAPRVGRGRRRTIGAIALAASLVVACVVPWMLDHETKAPQQQGARMADAELEALYAQSAQLESLLAYARDDRVASGSAVAVAAQLDQRLADIDAALAQPGLPRTQQHALWRQRVATLRTFASFESNRRLLSARGQRYDGALLRVD